jgi:hypothetical protein
MKVNGLWGLGTVASMDQFGVHFLRERERERATGKKESERYG